VWPCHRRRRAWNAPGTKRELLRELLDTHQTGLTHAKRRFLGALMAGSLQFSHFVQMC
jgi:hypothetical protein